MTHTYLIHAWCVRPFITFLDPVEAATPEEAIIIARRNLAKLLDTAEEYNAHYPRDEFAACDENGEEMLRVLDPSAPVRETAPVLRETLDYVAQVLAGFKPAALRQLGLDMVLEHVEIALAIESNPC